MPFKTILFDLDGVLVDACEWHYEALNIALEEILSIKISRYQHKNMFNGLPTRKKLQILGLKPELIETINTRKQEITSKIIDEKCVPDKKHLQLLSRLADEGFKIGCVSNSIRSSIVRMLEATDQLYYMDFIVSNESVLQNKPFPDCYNFAMNRLGSDPGHTIIVEDSDVGLKSAYASDAKYVWKVNDATEVNIKNYERFLKDENIDPDGW